MNSYQRRLFCRCGYSFYTSFADGSHYNVTGKCCPSCGIEPYWKARIVKWVSTSKLHHPSTWGNGEWEDAES